MRLGLFRRFMPQPSRMSNRRNRPRSIERTHNRLGLLESLESRVLLSGFGTAGVAAVLSNPVEAPGQAHVDRVAWSPSPGESAQVSVFVNNNLALPFTASQLARIDDAIAQLNRTWDAAQAIGLQLVKTMEASRAQIVLSQARDSACGGRLQGVLGCAEYYVYAQPSGQFADGAAFHRFAGPELGLQTQVTLISSWNWYSESDSALIGATEFDFSTVVTHELGHATGLEHDKTGQSPMAPTLAPGETRRILSDQDIADLRTLYASQATATATTDPAPVDEQPGANDPGSDQDNPAPDDNCDSPNDDNATGEQGNGDQEDPDCDTKGGKGGMGESPTPQQQGETVLVIPVRTETPVAVPRATAEVAISTRGLAAEQPGLTGANTLAFIEARRPLEAAARRSITASGGDAAVAAQQVLQPLPSPLAGGSAVPRSGLALEIGAATSETALEAPNQEGHALRVDSALAEPIRLERASPATRSANGRRLQFGAPIDTTGCAIMSVLLCGLWGTQNVSPAQPKSRFLIDHLVDLRN